MENNIEEDITKIDTYIELVLEKDYCNCNELNTILGKHCDGSKNVAYAMQHILSDYKRVLKENGELREKVKQLEEENKTLNERNQYLVKYRAKLEKELYESNENYIPKSKVKDKIEEYDKQRIKMEKDDIGVGFTLGKEWSDLKAKIEVLQELLREE